MTGKSHTPLEIRFWNKVDKKGPDDCWEWKGAHCQNGRGAYEIDGSVKYASRVAYMLFHHINPGRWEFVCHTCDNGNCCNPSHLYLGNQLSNMHDMSNRGRKVIKVGEEAPRTKLTIQQVKEIREKYIPFLYSQFKLAKEYKVSRSTIEAIIHRENWKSI